MTSLLPERSALIIDDLKFNRTMLRSTLARLGYAVAEAASAPEAFACLDRQRFDVVFLDWELPDIKGDVVARHIRATCGDLPIVTITADTSDAMRARSAAAGSDGFLGKAFDLASVRAMLATLNTLRRRHSESSPPASPAPVAPPAGIRTVLATHASQFPGGLAEALRHCREQLDAEWSRLLSAIGDRQRDIAIRAAHNLGSLAGIVGATRVHDTAHACERVLRVEPDFGQPLTDALAALVTALHDVQTELEDNDDAGGRP
ncbi:histidine kinase [Opitutaceae bacterium TAV5]|nr:histidine kinase [Opitutaceae bacterium TAV5]